ncbi:MAG: ABC transporter, partial [Cyanobacteriota bacterium]|nr:ABC transporter [Cyanobacteriota bacterium]
VEEDSSPEDSDATETDSEEETEEANPTDSEEEETENTEDDEEVPETPQSEENSSEDDRELPSQTKEARLVVFGNSTFASNGWFGEQINGDVFLNSMQWLANTDESILSIRPKQPQNRRLNLTLGQASAIGWLAVVVVPLLGFAIAGLMWWRRR